MKLNRHLHWGSHLPVLMRLMEITEGDVLELGTGLYSTPFLHYACMMRGRKLISFENDPQFYETYKDYACPTHEIIFVEDWSKADIHRKCDIVFIDTNPEEIRKDLAAKVADCARYVALHDSQPQAEKWTHYSEIYPLFRKRYDYTGQSPHTTVLSNFHNTDLDLHL